jgi:hypothetical protein
MSAMSNSTVVRPVAAALIHVDRWKDGRTGIMKLTGAFRDYARESKGVEDLSL